MYTIFVSISDQYILNRFIAFLKNYTNDQMDFAFSAERSIQDGLVEISETDASTVLISYIVMFVYIAVVLGRISSLRFIWVPDELFCTKSLNFL